MGCSVSCYRSTTTFDGVRVVHINGYVEDFPGPVTVGEVTGKPPRLVCFSPAQLVSFTARPLGLDDLLEPGRLYFLLPPSVLHSESSPVDLAALATRLTALARSSGRVAAPGLPSRSKLPLARVNEFNSAAGGHADDGSAWKPEPGTGRAYAGGGIGGGVSSAIPLWKPILETIQESFRRSTIDERSLGRSTTGLSSPGSSAYSSRLLGEEERPS